MAATADTMHMALSPGLDAIKSSPLSASSESLQLGDYLDLNAMPSPGITNAQPKQQQQQQQQQPLPQQQAQPQQQQQQASSASSAQKPPMNNQLTPPPPGSPPESIFRYYLKLELRKMGSPADDTIIDKYVQQHYGTFLKAMENGKAPSMPSTNSAPKKPSTPAPAPPTTTTTKMSNPQPRASTSAARDATRARSAASPSTATTSMASPASIAETYTSVSPQPQPSPFKVPMPLDATGSELALDTFHIKPEPAEHPLFSHIDPQYMQLGHGVPASDLTAQALEQHQAHHHHLPEAAATAPPPEMMPPLRRRSSDAMSEDDVNGLAQDDEETKDHLAPLAPTSRFDDFDHTSRFSDSRSSIGRDDSEEPQTRGGVPVSIRDSAAANLRPTAEEYRALSSKEKRQLRNKISARNFRERRKEYITHLEGEIADRDAIISSLRSQMSNMSLHNKKLEEEVKTLQARQLSSTDVSKILEALGQAAGIPITNTGNDNLSQQIPQQQSQSSGLRPSASSDLALSAVGTPGILSSRPSTPSSPRPSLIHRRGSPALPQHNPRKDLSANGTSASSKSGSFWGSGPTVAASA